MSCLGIKSSRLSIFLICLVITISCISAFNFGQAPSSSTVFFGNLTNITQMADVNIVTPITGEGLIYNAVTGAWENGVLATVETLWNANYSDYLTTKTYASNDTNYNASGLIRNWNSTGYIQNWSAIITEGGEPLWNANYSNFLIGYNYATNTTYYLKSNPFGYYNVTTAPTYLNDTFRQNYSDYLTIRNYALNDTNFNSSGLIKDWNTSGLIKDFNASSLIRDWNSTGYISNWNSTGYIQNWSAIISGSEPLWNANYTDFLGKITWANAMNGTLMNNSWWNTNYSTNDADWRNRTNLSYVPYTGATGNVNIGVFDFTAGNLYASYLGGTVGSIDMSASPWIVVANLSVSGYINPATTLIYDLGSGSNRWRWLYVQNISSDYINNAYDISTANLNASGNITALGYFLGNGSQLTDIDYTELDPYWNTNYSNFTAVYGYALNGSYLWNNNYTTFLTHIDWSKVINGTMLSQADYNSNYSTLMLQGTWNTNYTSNNDAWLNTTNLTYNAYNSSGLIRNWNSSSLIINWSLESAIESDPYWTDNYSNFSTIYAYALNDTNFNSSGLIRDWNTTGYIKNWTVDINSANSSATSWVDNLFPQITELVGLVGNWTLDKVNYFTKTETTGYINANISSANTSMKNYVDLLNNTGLIKDWNASGIIVNYNGTNLIINWNATGYIANWQVPINSANTSLAYYTNTTVNDSMKSYVDSKLITTFYNMTDTQVVRGTPAGVNTNVNIYDSIPYNVTEASGSNGLDFRVNFTGITEFNQLIVRAKGTSGETHITYIQLYDYENNEWENYGSVGAVTDYGVFTWGVFDASNHISSGIVQLRFYIISNGNTGHTHYFDWITISKGTSTPSGVETDPYSVHKDGTIPLTANWGQGTFNLTDTGSWFLGLINHSQIQNQPTYLTSETNWNANYSEYLTKPIWTNVMNGTVTNGFYNSTNAPIYLNDTFRQNYSDYLTTKTYASNDTDYFSFNYYNSTNAPIYLNDTFRGSNYTEFIAHRNYLSNNTYGYYNSTNAPIYLNDTFRGTNYSTFLTHLTYAQALNGTLMLSANWNATNTSYYLTSNPSGFYNSTNAPIYLNDTFRNNYSDYLTIRTYATNDTNYNSSGLIKDWNTTGYIQNWSAIISNAETLWNGNYSNVAFKNMNNQSIYNISNLVLGNFATPTDVNKFQVVQDGGGTPTSMGGTSLFEVDALDGLHSDFNFRLSQSGNAGYPTIIFSKSAGTLESPSNIANGEHIGQLQFNGYAQGNWQVGAQIEGLLNGTINTGDISDLPTNLIFYTAPDNSATPIARMTIYPDGNVNVPLGIFSQNKNLSIGYDYATNGTFTTGGITWDNAINGTLMLSANWNATNTSYKTTADYNTNYTTNDPIYRGFQNNYSDYVAIRSYALNDSLWTSNYSNFSTGWNYATNSTLSWANAVNGTLMLQSNWNATNTSYATWANAVNGTLLSTATYNTNYTTNQPILKSWLDNYTAYGKIINWSNIENGTLVNWTSASNGTLLLTSTWNTNYTTNQPIWKSWGDNYSNYLRTETYATNGSKWTANYSNISTGWNYAVNGSKWTSNYSNFSTVYAYAINSTGTLTAETLWNANYSTYLTKPTWTIAYNGTLAKTDALNNFGAFNQSFNTNTLFVDATNGGVGIGTNAILGHVLYVDGLSHFTQGMQIDGTGVWSNNYNGFNSLNERMVINTLGDAISFDTGSTTRLNITNSSVKVQVDLNVLENINATKSIFSQNKNLSIGYDYATNGTFLTNNTNIYTQNITLTNANNCIGKGSAQICWI